MKKTVMRPTEISICDLCSQENEYLTRCPLCQREMCLVHAAYGVRIHRFMGPLQDSSSFHRICLPCSTRLFNTTIATVIDHMLEGGKMFDH